jgi:hypothetical protein
MVKDPKFYKLIYVNYLIFWRYEVYYKIKQRGFKTPVVVYFTF